MVRIASLQGARDANEDRVQLLPIAAGARLACVHDGHAGTEVVEALCKLWEDRVRMWAQGADWGTPAMTTLRAMSHLHSAMENFSYCLRDKTSGAVSIAALCLGDGRVVMAWLGDCEGCVFSPTSGILRAHELWVWDTAAAHQAALLVGGGALAVRTTPHSLLAGLDPAHYPTLFAPDDDAHAAHAVTLTSLPGSAEYALCLQHCGHKPLEVDVVTIRRGAYHAFADARLHAAVQPTRVFGDREMGVRTGVLRAPALIGSTAATTTTTDSTLLLLCSDGMFSEGAFPNLAAVVRCAMGPTRYLQEELMRRPLFGGLARSAGIGALAQRCRECATWPQMLRFIAGEYLAVLQRPEVIDAYAMLAASDPIVTLPAPLTTTTTTTTTTDAKFKFKFNTSSSSSAKKGGSGKQQPPPKRASSSSPRRKGAGARRTSLDLAGAVLLSQQLRLPQSYHHWLQTCVASIEWLSEVHNHNHAELGAEGLAHLAIVLGSSDNVSVMLLGVVPRTSTTASSRPAEALLRVTATV